MSSISRPPVAAPLPTATNISSSSGGGVGPLQPDSDQVRTSFGYLLFAEIDYFAPTDSRALRGEGFT
jgi:hypothetical protein